MRKGMACLLILSLLLLCGCQGREPKKGCWEMGFGKATLNLPEQTDAPLYIAGYHTGWEIEGVRDLQQARAVWLSDGITSTVLISVDCIGLGSDTVGQIRDRLADFCRQTGCDGVQVVATHTHAGVDTLGLWGPVGLDGKNPEFMEILIEGAVQAAKDAYADRAEGTLSFSKTETQGLQADSRDPQVFDRNLYQLCFTPKDAAKNGIRMVSFAAHAEALRGDNRQVSRDFPGLVCDIIEERTGEDALFLPGAIGGLIMTPVLTEGAFDAEENLMLTGQALAETALSAPPGEELPPQLRFSTVQWETPLENTIFLYYKFLGILQNEVRQGINGTYYLQTELSVLQLGDVTVAMLPGEIFPELIFELRKTQLGAGQLLVVGLANDEIGYIVPLSDFRLDAELPYLQEAEGDHYEETNSVGRNCAADLADAFRQALKGLE